MDMVAARIRTLPYVPTWGLIAMASSRLSLTSASGFPLCPSVSSPRSPGKGLQQPQSVGQLEHGSGSIALERLQDTCLLDLNPATSCQARE